MFHQNPVFKLVPEALEDDRVSENRHILTFPVWFYIRYGQELRLKEDVVDRVRSIFPDLTAEPRRLLIPHMPSLEECAHLQALADTLGCTLEAEQRTDADFQKLRKRLRARRTGGVW